MNNEEKILSMLEALTQGQAELKAEVKELKQGQAKLEQGQANLEQKVNHLSVMTEEVQHNVKIIAEGHAGIIDKLDSLPDFDVSKADIEVLKLAVSDHSDKFNNLKKAL